MISHLMMERDNLSGLWDFVLRLCRLAGFGVALHDPSAFTAYVARRFRRALPGAGVTVATPLNLRYDEASATMNLVALYAACRRAPPESRAIIAGFVTRRLPDMMVRPPAERVSLPPRA